jgi:hypothetical protein
MSDLTPSYERETGQVILEGLPAGVAGEAGLVPVVGVDLAFDRADGHLVRVVVDADEMSEPGAAMFVRLFGQEAQGVIRDAATGPAEQPAVGPSEGRVLSPEPGLCSALSRLARLDAAGATSPVPRSSPWWEAEAARLAELAGLPARARAEGQQAVRGLAGAPEYLALPEEAAQTALAVADIAAADEPEAASQLRQSIGAAQAQPLSHWLAHQRQRPVPELDVASEVERLEKDQMRLPGLQRVLDPDLVPEGLFRPGLSPHSDLFIRDEGGFIRDEGGQSRIVVAVPLAPGAEREALDRCRVRLVDPAVRRVLADANFDQTGSWAMAELAPPFPLDELCETWIEVVEGKLRPVRSAKGHRIRRAMRWADAALRAERAPAGLAPLAGWQDWAALAAVAWERCRRDWEAAGDTDRAFLAAWRRQTVGATRRPATADPQACPPSATAAALARLVPLPGPSYLAEVLGG